MKKNTLIPLFIILLIGIPLVPLTHTKSQSSDLNQANGLFSITLKNNITHPISINIVFVNYNENLIKLDYIQSHLKSFSEMDLRYGRAKYLFNYSLSFAGSDLNRTIINYIEHNKKPDVTSDLLEQVLTEQVSLVNNGTLGVRRKIFENNITGYSIDAVKFEHFLSTISNTDSSFYIYVLNLSYMDNHILNREHWFTVSEKNVDSNRTRDFWRLEWDNALNKGVKFPYPAFNSKTRVFFLDPTAYNWYLNWTRIWWGGIYQSPAMMMYYRDLDHYIDMLNLSNEADLLRINDYISSWLNDIVRNIFGEALDAYLSEGDFYTTSISIQLKIVNLRPDIIPTRNLTWTVHPAYIRKAFSELYPNLTLSIDIQYHNISDYPRIQQLLNSTVYSVNETSGWTYYNGFSLYNFLSAYNNTYFKRTSAQKSLIGWIFILYNGSMVVPYYRKEFTGLGGRGQIMIMMDIHRIMGDDLKTYKQGFTSIIIHELGHAVGALHTFTSRSYGSDFAFDVMGYYPASWNFSEIRRNTMLREISDQRLLKIYKTLGDALNKNPLNKTSKEAENKIYSFLENLTRIERLINNTKYWEANIELTQLEKALPSIISIISTSTEKQTNGENIFNTITIVIIVTIIVGTIVIVLSAYYVLKTEK